MASYDKLTPLDPISTITPCKVALLDVSVERNLIALIEGALRLIGQYCFFL